MSGLPPTALAPTDGRTSALTGEFRDRGLEAEFRRATLDEWAARVRVVSVLASLLVLGFGYIDYRALGPGPELTLMWSVRAGLVAIAFGLACGLSPPGSPARLDRSVLLMMLAITTVVVAVTFTRRREVALETPVSLLAVIGFYLFLPARFPVQIGGALCLSASYLLAQALWSSAAPALWVSAAVAHLLCNALGGYTALRNHLLLRREFLALQQAHRATAEEARRTRELQESVAALERSNHELEQYAAVAAHDLRAPLRTVTGFAQLLRKRFAASLGAQGAEYIDMIASGTRHMDRLIADLLAFSRLGRGDSGFIEVSMEDVLAQAEYQLGAQIRETQARIAHDLLPGVRGTAIELLQLLQNLIGNALKFRAPGVHPTVHVSARRDREFWVFSVRDNGIGIEPEYRERIFEMFQRLHDAETYEGTGIGLAICRKIVQHHGGRIWVQSDAGNGSTFCFTLPAHLPGGEAGSAAM